MAPGDHQGGGPPHQQGNPNPNPSAAQPYSGQNHNATGQQRRWSNNQGRFQRNRYNHSQSGPAYKKQKNYHQKNGAFGTKYPPPSLGYQPPTQLPPHGAPSHYGAPGQYNVASQYPVAHEHGAQHQPPQPAAPYQAYPPGSYQAYPTMTPSVQPTYDPSNGYQQTQPAQPITNTSNGYQQTQPAQAVPNAGNGYQQTQPAQAVPNAGNGYQQTQPAQAVPNTSNGYQQTQPAQPIPNAGNVYQHTYPGQAVPNAGNVYQHTYPGQAVPNAGNVYQHTYPGQAVPNAGNGYQQTYPGQAVPNAGNVYQHTYPGQAVPNAGNGYQQTYPGQPAHTPNNGYQQAYPGQPAHTANNGYQQAYPPYGYPVQNTYDPSNGYHHPSYQGYQPHATSAYNHTAPSNAAPLSTDVHTVANASAANLPQGQNQSHDAEAASQATVLPSDADVAKNPVEPYMNEDGEILNLDFEGEVGMPPEHHNNSLSIGLIIYHPAKATAQPMSSTLVTGELELLPAPQSHGDATVSKYFPKGDDTGMVPSITETEEPDLAKGDVLHITFAPAHDQNASLSDLKRARNRPGDKTFSFSRPYALTVKAIKKLQPPEQVKYQMEQQALHLREQQEFENYINNLRAARAQALAQQGQQTQPVSQIQNARPSQEAQSSLEARSIEEAQQANVVEKVKQSQTYSENGQKAEKDSHGDETDSDNAMEMSDDESENETGAILPSVAQPSVQPALPATQPSVQQAPPVAQPLVQQAPPAGQPLVQQAPPPNVLDSLEQSINASNFPRSNFNNGQPDFQPRVRDSRSKSPEKRCRSRQGSQQPRGKRSVAPRDATQESVLAALGVEGSPKQMYPTPGPATDPAYSASAAHSAGGGHARREFVPKSSGGRAPGPEYHNRAGQPGTGNGQFPFGPGRAPPPPPPPTVANPWTSHETGSPNSVTSQHTAHGSDFAPDNSEDLDATPKAKPSAPRTAHERAVESKQSRKRDYHEYNDQNESENGRRRQRDDTAGRKPNFDRQDAYKRNPYH